VHALAFDAARGSTLLFGGSAGASVVGDAWQLASPGWTRLHE
jgi:hypothetical protein